MPWIGKIYVPPPTGDSESPSGSFGWREILVVLLWTCVVGVITTFIVWTLLEWMEPFDAAPRTLVQVFHDNLIWVWHLLGRLW